MNNEIARYSEETFESIKHVNEYGNEFSVSYTHLTLPTIA